ncbi:MAG TPA: feruloyl-CoA synthase [Chryseolinea sp.]
MEINTTDSTVTKEVRADGSILIRSTVALQPTAHRLTGYLAHWAKARPEKVFVAQRSMGETYGKWDSLTYSEVFKRVRNISQALLSRNLSSEHPVVVLSGNSIEHALVGLACLHVGIPFSPLAPAYSLRSADFDKLRHIFRLLTPGLVFVKDAVQYEKALAGVASDIEIVSLTPPKGNFNYTSFDELLKTPAKQSVDEAHLAIEGHSIAKILFTSGSTGLSKGVINTHENLTTNLQQITQTFPFFRDEDLELVDWLPWNHTFGGNHNFGITLFNGGTLYIDDGNPTPEGISRTVDNLAGRKPTTYFNVPKGFEMLLPFLRSDAKFRQEFFSNLKMLFYAGAGMAQHVWDALESLSLETTGNKIMIGTGLGCTESCPSALFASKPGGYSGLLGVPVPGMDLKLVRRQGKLEARYKGKNIFPGYWRQPELTAQSFDDEGFYCTGDALLFVDESDPTKGMLFNGRIAEDFKLSTGTWVSVGVIKAQLIAEGNGLIQDAVITGHDRAFVGAIIFPDPYYCRNKFLLGPDVGPAKLSMHAGVLGELQAILTRMAKKSTGSSTLIKRGTIANFSLSLDKGEITDKGSINQQAILQNHPDIVERIYRQSVEPGVVEAE